jgi:hypothetical protein
MLRHRYSVNKNAVTIEGSDAINNSVCHQRKTKRLPPWIISLRSQIFKADVYQEFPFKIRYEFFSLSYPSHIPSSRNRSFTILQCKRYSYPCNRSWRAIGLRDIEAPTSSRQSAHRWRWGYQPYARSALYPQEDSQYSFRLEAESTSGAILRLEKWGQLKIQ